MAAREQLAAQGVQARVVSMPSWELFDAQDAAYRESVLPAAVTARVSVEAGVTMGWERYVGLAGRDGRHRPVRRVGQGPASHGVSGHHAGERGAEGAAVCWESNVQPRGAERSGFRGTCRSASQNDSRSSAAQSGAMDYLFTPWRMEYIRSAKKDGCIFCDMLEMDDRAALILHRGRHAFLVLNRYPYNNGHFMSVPYRHVDTLEVLTAEEMARDDGAAVAGTDRAAAGVESRGLQRRREHRQGRRRRREGSRPYARGAALGGRHELHAALRRHPRHSPDARRNATPKLRAGVGHAVPSETLQPRDAPPRVRGLRAALKDPPLVLVHGAGGDLMQWPTDLRRLPGRRVFALDLPGHGKSGGEPLVDIAAVRGSAVTAGQRRRDFPGSSWPAIRWAARSRSSTPCATAAGWPAWSCSAPARGCVLRRKSWPASSERLRRHRRLAGAVDVRGGADPNLLRLGARRLREVPPRGALCGLRRL